MEIEITSQKENALLDRIEVHFRIAHPKEKTPAVGTVRAELSQLLSVSRDLLVVNDMDTQFGISETRGYAKAYKNQNSMLKIEREHILKRNQIKAPGSGKETPAEPAPPPKPEPAPASEEGD